MDLTNSRKSALDSQFATLGDDSTVIPEEARATVLDSLKTVRVQLKQTMTVVHEQAQTLLNE
ncbi:hypothetical protein HO793_00915 [Streptococcus suis]|uniref:hypothetical protein n=1 Tax=Streptococcus suis TaxID=1307 RepID=UPI000768C203|nr:hypothetical protein [Streptococcus suis]MDX5051334.1 hypothetical protein [Streptococcus suis]NQG24479.1 hypothetical protein [Streptococcus suis]NQG50443.1 hypothetical protein [Streptococcus suis]NQQ34169.1 hypothetical protein [Streptococcus suis]NQQ59999.1 hypothetical protein [Streptococcus suis]